MRRKNLTVLVFLSAAAALALTPLPGAAQADQDPAVLLERAVQLETIDGDLEAAIQLYRQIAENNGGDRPVAARALLRLGECYEKLGQSGAQEAYRQVIENYPDQQVHVATARERLAALVGVSSAAAPGPHFREVDFPFRLEFAMPDGVFGAALSPDGKEFALNSNGAVWVVPLEGEVGPEVTGEPRRVTPPMDVGEGFTWSADGNWIAFNSLEDENGGRDIYVVSSRGGEPKRVVYRPRFGEAEGPGPGSRLSLSPDGNVLAFTSVGEDGNQCVATVAVDGGVAKCITESMSADPAFSSDGRYIAYIHETRFVEEGGTEARNEVRVIPADGGRSVLVTEGPGSTGSPIWSPDGRMIAFRTSYREISVVPVSEGGRETRSSMSIKLPQGRTFYSPVGWGAGNRIGLHSMEPRRAAIFTVPASGGKATQVTPEHVGPEHELSFLGWTPIGEAIWLWRMNFEGTWNVGLGYVPSSGGTITRVSTEPVNPVPQAGSFISPDGKTVVFSGLAEGVNGVALWAMPTEGGRPIQLTKGPRLQDRYPCWMPDSKSVLFVRDEPTAANIYMVPVEGGELRPITSDTDKVSWAPIACSPDGRSVAYFAQDEMDETSVGWHISEADTIKVRPLADGEAKVVASVEHHFGGEQISWSPDGRQLAYNDKRTIWVVSADGGEPVEIPTGLEEHLPLNVAWSPDGERIAFTGVSDLIPELWLMEDFLPASEQ